MKEYVITLVGVALVCGFASMLSPDGEKGSLRSHIGLLSGLCVLCITAGPILSFVSEFSGGELDIFGELGGDYAEREEFEDIYNGNLMVEGAASMSLGLENMLCRDLGLRGEDIEVSSELYEGEESYVVKNVTVTLSGGAVFEDPHAVVEYVETLLGCECEIIYE